MSHDRGDVVWSDDPFKHGTAGRPWLVLNDDTHPFGDEQHMAVALSTSGHDAALPIREDDWVEGGTPKRSYVLPWADSLATTSGRHPSPGPPRRCYR